MKPNIPPVLIIFALVCFALVQNTQAVSPPPDGGYPGFNTAEGQNALFGLTTGAANTAVGWFSLFSNAGGSFNTAAGVGALLFNTADNNTAFGAAALLFNTVGGDNTAVGAATLLNNTEGSFNTAIGFRALESNITGGSNTAIGEIALFSNTTGSGNTAIGRDTLFDNTTGTNNIAIGVSAGANLTTGDNNIDIGNAGETGESNTIRIGTSQDRTFIAGIRGIEPPVGVLLPVVIDLDGQLGTTVSSRQFKQEIKSMDATSEAILALQPVTFHYKTDKMGTPQFGLIAEEVAKVNPDLVVRDKNGEVYTVRYDAVNAMLLNEFLKEHRKNEEQQATIAQLKSGMEALTATVKEQAAQIQKVSAQLEVSKPAPQVVNNNQ